MNSRRINGTKSKRQRNTKLQRRGSVSGTSAERSREFHLRRWYGITTEQYDDLLQRQDGCCAVCRRSHKEFKTRLSVDHNHRTLEVRGLLCTHCNRYVIGRHTDPDLFERAAAYLRQGTGWLVPQNRPRRRRRKKKAR